MPGHRTVSAPYVNYMLKIAAERGIDCAVLLGQLGIDPASVQRNEPMAAERYCELYQSVGQQLSQEWFGMLSGDTVPRGAIRYLCLLAVHCSTLATNQLKSSCFKF